MKFNIGQTVLVVRSGWHKFDSFDLVKIIGYNYEWKKYVCNKGHNTCYMYEEEIAEYKGVV